MRYLLDTHILIWVIVGDERLTDGAKEIIEHPDNMIYFSAASVWEVTIKNMKSPERIPVNGDVLVKYCNESGMIALPVVNDHALMIHQLSRRDGQPGHSDPFDRMLIAQAKTEGMIFLTHDGLLAGYNEPCVQIV